MVRPADPKPVGAPDNWPVRLTAQSGIQVVYGAPHSRQPPGVKKLRGIGVKMRKGSLTSDRTRNPQDWDSSWGGLYEQRLHELCYQFIVTDHVVLRANPNSNDAIRTTCLHLPMMGMPPREPTRDMMKEVRTGSRLTGWFRYAFVFKATDLKDSNHFDRSVEGKDLIKVTKKPDDEHDGDDVVITLPSCNKDTLSRLYTETQDSVGFEFRTALPDNDEGHSTKNVRVENLWFIQLLPNELPSYHFWVSPEDTPERRLLSSPDEGVRQYIDAPGSPHYQYDGASRRQEVRSPRHNPKPSPPPSPKEKSPGPADTKPSADQSSAYTLKSSDQGQKVARRSLSRTPNAMRRSSAKGQGDIQDVSVKMFKKVRAAPTKTLNKAKAKKRLSAGAECR